jgi:uncharacterized protein (TIGR02246 family)
MPTSLTPSALHLEGLEAMPAADRGLITATLTALLTGFATRDADLLAGVYTADADWVNAFGSVKRGADEITAYLRGLFADENFDEGQLVAPPTSTLRRLGDDVALVSTQLQIRGQGLVGGGAIALRNNHSLRVLQRQADGAWRVVSEMYMDAREDRSYAGHS